MTIYWVVLISTLSQIGFGGSRVAVSLFALDLGANQLTVGVIVALYHLCPMFLSIAIGKYADTVSPRLPMIIGSVLMAAALMLMPLWPHMEAVYVAAFFLGLGHLVFSLPLDNLTEADQTKLAALAKKLAAGEAAKPLAAEAIKIELNRGNFKTVNRR